MEQASYVTFPENETDKDSSFDLYKKIFPRIPNPRLDIFFSHPITSAGVRDFFISTDPSLPPEIIVPEEERLLTVIEKNRQLATSLSSDFGADSGRLALPAHIGFRPGWGEFDYTRFWFYFISGVDLPTASSFETQAKAMLSDTQTFNDHIADRSEREALYRRLTTSFLDHIAPPEVNKNPVAKMVFLPNAEISLGCTTERMIAQALNIPTSRVVIEASIEQVDDLATDRDRIYGYGAQNGILPTKPFEIDPEERAELDRMYGESLANPYQDNEYDEFI